MGPLSVVEGEQDTAKVVREVDTRRGRWIGGVPDTKVEKEGKSGRQQRLFFFYQ